MTNRRFGRKEPPALQCNNWLLFKQTLVLYSAGFQLFHQRCETHLQSKQTLGTREMHTLNFQSNALFKKKKRPNKPRIYFFLSDFSSIIFD